MKYLIVHAHPEANSFNGGMTRAAADFLSGSGHDVQVSDLYAMNWNPRSDRANFLTVANPDFYKQQKEEIYASEHHGFAPDVAAEVDKLLWCDALVLQFPFWWFGMPAMLKGWFDRVLVQDRIYGGGRSFESGSLYGRRALVSITIGGSPEWYEPGGRNGELSRFLYPIEHVLRFLGFDVAPTFVSWQPDRSDDDVRAQYLEGYCEALASLEKPASQP